MRVVPLNQVGVVAVHRTDEVCKGGEKGWRQAAAETGRFLGKVERLIRECSAMSRALADEQGLHERGDFAPIPCFYVRFHSRLYLYSNLLYISNIRYLQGRYVPLLCPV